MKILPLIFLLNLSAPVFAQHYSQDSVAARRAALKENNSWILGAWAAANMIQGSISAGNAKGSDAYFHRMNVYWNSVNLALAGIGLWAARKELAGPHSFERNYKGQQKTEKLLLLNTGLDLAYITTGLYLKERGNRLSGDQPLGYGNSLLLQGSFLLVFDLVGYFENRQITKLLEEDRNNWQLGTTTNGIGLSYRF